MDTFTYDTCVYLFIKYKCEMSVEYSVEAAVVSSEITKLLVKKSELESWFLL